jgi:hypothetical protein
MERINPLRLSAPHVGVETPNVRAFGVSHRKEDSAMTFQVRRFPQRLVIVICLYGITVTIDIPP